MESGGSDQRAWCGRKRLSGSGVRSAYSQKCLSVERLMRLYRSRSLTCSGIITKILHREAINPLVSVWKTIIVYRQILVLAGREYISFRKNRALVDNFFKLCMVLCMDMTFSKTTAHKLRETSSGRYTQNPRWPPLETVKAISWLISTL